jgi:GTP cyclohydrolase I
MAYGMYGTEQDFTEAHMASLEAAAKTLLEGACGLQPDEHGGDTPKRFVAMLKELTTPQPFEFKVFDSKDADQMIIVRNIPFVSVCNHHVIPFVGKADIGYIPGPYHAGLSKFARVVKYYAAGLQVQERLTKQVADFLEAQLAPRGLAVVMESEHMCMTIRGVQAPGTTTYTAEMRGFFNDHDRTAKAEFLDRINGKH